MAISDFAAGAQNALRDMLARRLQEQALAQRQQQQDFENSLRVRQQDQQERYQREQLEGLTAQREAQAAVRRELAANRVVDDLAPGDVLGPEQGEMLRAGGRGSLVERQAATLPSAQTSGFLSMPGAAKPAGGFIRTTRAGNPEQDVYRGTRAQRAHRELLESLPADSSQRRIVEYEAATGRNAPAAFQPTPPREPTPRYSALQTYEPDGTPGDVVRFNSVTGEAAPLNLGGGFLRTGSPSTSRNGLPSRVQGFLLDLRGRHSSYDDALRELQRTFASAPDETFDRLDAATKLRQLYAQPSGLSDFEQQFGGLDAPAILGGGSRPVQPPRPAPGASQTITRAELQAVAQQLGVSEAEAAAQARQRQLTVID